MSTGDGCGGVEEPLFGAVVLFEDDDSVEVVEDIAVENTEVGIDIDMGEVRVSGVAVNSGEGMRSCSGVDCTIGDGGGCKDRTAGEVGERSTEGDVVETEARANVLSETSIDLNVSGVSTGDVPDCRRIELRGDDGCEIDGVADPELLVLLLAELFVLMA